jgi:hypothetical protein
MIRSRLFRTVILASFTATMIFGVCLLNTTAQRRRVRHASVCGNPQLACPTSATFEPWDLPFRLPRNSVIYDTELFYAVMLKSMRADDNNCNLFIPENQRLAAQALFPDHKVFTSRCPDVETKMYTNVAANTRFMAVYAGSTLADANRMLAAVKATGKYPGANIRRMRTGFNGT